MVDAQVKAQETEEATARGKKEGAREAQRNIHSPDVETRNIGPPALDAFPPMQPVQLNMAAAAAATAEPRFNQDMQQDNEPLNLSVKNNADSDFGIIDIKSGALDLSLKK